MNQKLIRWIAGTAVLPLVLSGCQLIPAEETFPEVTYQKTDDQITHTMTEVKRGDLINEVEVMGSYVTQVSYPLSFEIGGEKLSAVYVEKGQIVKAGELLMELEAETPTEDYLALQDKVDTLKLKKTHLEENRLLEQKRQDALLASIDAQLAAVREKLKNGSTSTLRAQETQLVKDRANQEKAKANANQKYLDDIQDLDEELYIENLRLTEMEASNSVRQIRSPIDGVVTGLKQLYLGDEVTKGKVMVTVSDMSNALFRFETDKADLFAVGETGSIQASGKTWEAVRVSAEEAGVPETSTGGKTYLYFKLTDPDPTLTNGVLSKVLESRMDVLYLEKSAIRNFGNGDVVYVLDEQKQRKQVPVTTGLQVGQLIEIVSGLEEGMEVIHE